VIDTLCDFFISIFQGDASSAFVALSTMMTNNAVLQDIETLKHLAAAIVAVLPAKIKPKVMLKLFPGGGAIIAVHSFLQAVNEPKNAQKWVSLGSDILSAIPSPVTTIPSVLIDIGSSIYEVVEIIQMLVQKIESGEIDNNISDCLDSSNWMNDVKKYGAAKMAPVNGWLAGRCNMDSDLVIRFQRFMNNNGRNVNVDGAFGLATRRALQYFLNDKHGAGLWPDGNLGAKSCNAFRAWLNSQNPQNRVASSGMWDAPECCLALDQVLAAKGFNLINSKV